MRTPEHRGEAELHLPKQVALPFYGRQLDVNGLADGRGRDIEYLGKAVHVFDNIYRCLAIVGGMLCVVEVTIAAHEPTFRYQEV